MPDAKEQANRVSLEFTKKDLKFDCGEVNGEPKISLTFGGGDFVYTSIRITVIFDSDGKSAKIIAGPIASAPLERTSQVLLTVNDCNMRFRWVKFYLDGDNDIIADADTLFSEEDVGPVVYELVMRMASILDDTYPDIMKAIWA